MGGTEKQKVRTDAGQAVLADCNRARLDRVALLILAATAITLLVIIRSRRAEAADTDSGTPSGGEERGLTVAELSSPR